jgi:TolA-binding protein
MPTGEAFALIEFPKTLNSGGNRMIVQHTGMRTVLIGICLMLGTVAAFAATPPSSGSESPDSADLSTVKREWAETVTALTSYTAAQRDMAVARARQELDSMDRHIEQLESRTRQEWDSLNQEARETRETALRALRKQRNEVAEWYGSMKYSSADAWDSVRQGFIDSYGVLNDAFSKAWREFEDHPEETP